MMFRFHSCACLSGCCGRWVHMQSVGGERNEDRCLFLWLVQYGTRGKCPSFCCKNFFVTFLNCSVIHLSSTEHVSPFFLRAIMCDRPGTADACITNRVRRCWVCCGQNCVKLHLAVQLSGANITDWDITEPLLEWDWHALIGRLRHFCSVAVMLTWHRWRYWHKLHTVDWQYKLSTYSTCSPQFYRGSLCVTTNRATPHL
jgi:hypothetical protein